VTTDPILSESSRSFREARALRSSESFSFEPNQWTMAQSSSVEDPSTDFSGLASSLLPPSGAFLSGWAPQKWQRPTPSYSAHAMQNVQPPFSNSYNGAPLQTDLQGSSHKLFDPNENGTSDHAPSSGELSELASVTPSKSTQAEFYQVCPASCCATSLTQVAGHEQQGLWS
jgi:hypothetical protein